MLRTNLISYDKLAPPTVGGVSTIFSSAPRFRECLMMFKLHKISRTARKTALRTSGISYDCILNSLRDAKSSKTLRGSASLRYFFLLLILES